MGVDVKDIQFVARKVLMVSIKYCYGLVQKYPLVSGALSFFSILYIVFPTIFKIAIYASAVLSCFVVYFRFYLVSDNPKEQPDEKSKQEKPRISPKESRTEDSGSSGEVLIVVNRGNRSFVLRQTSRRRLVKEKNKAWDAESLNEEKDHVSSEGLSDCTNLIKESPEETEAENEFSSNVPDYGEVERQTEHTSPSNCGPLEGVMDSAQSKPDIIRNDGFIEKTENSSPFNGEINARNLEEMRGNDNTHLMPEQPLNKYVPVDPIDGKSMKDVPGGCKNTVESMDDNEENVMDLGESEQERTRRLESLIAKRKARRLFRLAIEKNHNTKRTASDQIAPIHISRTNHLMFPGNSDDSSIPGSAPSVLLPTRNPFDLPYDPSEEKPNLTEDSFQQEYMVPQQKEMFCRHESFSLGPSFPSESDHGQKSSKFSWCFSADKRVDRVGFSRFRSHSGEQDELAQLLIQENDFVSPIDRATDCPPHEGRIPITAKIESEENSHAHTCTWDVEENKMGNIHYEGTSGNDTDYLIGGNTSKLSSFSSEEVQGSESRDQVETDLNANTNVSSSSSENEGSMQGNNSQYQVETDLTDRNNSSSSSEEDEEFYSGRRTIISSAIKVPEEFCNAVQKSLVWSMPRNAAGRPPTYESSLGNDRRFMEDSLYYEERGPCLTSSYSIASDMVVEVSEVGSPPSTIEESHPNSDEESSRCNEVYGKENSHGSRDNLTTASSHRYETKVDNHMGTEKLELSGIERGWEEPPTFFSPREQPCEQGLADIDTSSSSKDDFIRKIHDEVKRVVEDSLTKAHQFPQEPREHKPQEFSYHSDDTSKEATADADVSLPVLHTNDDMVDLGSTEDRGNETVEAPRAQENIAGSSKLSENIHSDTSSISDKSVEVVVEEGSYQTSDQHMHLDLSIFDAENSVETRLMDEQPLEKTRLSVAENVHSIVEDQMTNPFYNDDIANSKDSTNSRPDVSVETIAMHNTNLNIGSAVTEAKHLRSPHTAESANPSGESEEENSKAGNLDALKLGESEVAESDRENVDNSGSSLDREAVAKPPKLPEQNFVPELDITHNDKRQHMVPVVLTDEIIISSRTRKSIIGQGITKDLSQMTDSSWEKSTEIKDGITENKGIIDLLELARSCDSSTGINFGEEDTKLTDYGNLGASKFIYTESRNSVTDKSDTDISSGRNAVVEPFVSTEAETDTVTEPIDRAGNAEDNLDSLGKSEDTSKIQTPESSNLHLTGPTRDKFSETEDTVSTSKPETKEDS